MPRMASCLEWGFPSTWPLRDRRDSTLMGDKVDMRNCMCGLCAADEPEPEPEKGDEGECMELEIEMDE